jgi:hypothetical protein
MKKIVIVLSVSLLCAALSGCIVVPDRGGYYGPAYGCYHCWR